jgi:hypothetical protein
VYLPILNSDLEGSDEDMDPLYEPLSSYHDPIYDVPKPCPLYEDPNQILLQDGILVMRYLAKYLL